MWLGEKAFLAQVERLAQRQATSGVPRCQRWPIRSTPEEVVGAVARTYGLPPTAVLD